MLHVDVDDGKPNKTEKDLHELEIRYPNIYNRRRERKARQEALQLTPRGVNHSCHFHFNHDDREADFMGRRHSIQGKEEKRLGQLQNSLDESKHRLRKLDEEAERTDFPQRSYQRRNTSPDVQFVPVSKPKALRERLQHNAERLNDLLYNRSPFSPRDSSPKETPRENGQVVKEAPVIREKREQNQTRIFPQVRRGSEGSIKILNKLSNGNVSKGNPSFNVVCQRIFDNQDKAEKERNSDFLFNSKWRRNSECNAIQTLHEDFTIPFMLRSPLQSPESQADSAIDVESVSVQSEVSSDNHLGGPSDVFSSTYSKRLDTNGKEPELSPLVVKRHWQSNEARSRPLHSLPNFVGDLAIRSLLSFSTEKDQSSGDESIPKSPDTPRSSVSLSPLVSPKRFKLQGQTTPKKSGPVRADHSLCSSTSSIPQSDRELEEIYLRTQGFSGSAGSIVHSSDEVDDTVDDTDPTREDPKTLNSVRVAPERQRHPRKQVYLVRKASEPPRYGRITPVSAASSSEGPAHCGLTESVILLDMRVNNSFDESKCVSYQKSKPDHRVIGDSQGLKSRSLNDVFDGDVETKLKMILQNGGSNYTDEHKTFNEYSSSTDSPLKSQSCLSFDNFTLNPRTGTEEEELTIVIDNIGESRTEDNISDDSKAVPTSDCASMSDHSEAKSSSLECSPRKYQSQLKIFPEVSGKEIPTEDEKLRKDKIVDSGKRDETSDGLGDDSLNSDSDRFDQSFGSRTSDCDTEFFMEAEFLDSAMKPKKTKFQKLFGGKKGKYNPAAQDIPQLAPKSQDQLVSKSTVESKSAPGIVVHPRKKSDSQDQANVSFTSKDYTSGQEALQLDEHQKPVDNEKGVTWKDVRFNVAENEDDGCIESYSGGLLRAGRINAYEAASLTENQKADVILEDKGDHIFHARPVVISSGKGSCLDLGISKFKKSQCDENFQANSETVENVKVDQDKVVYESRDSPRSITASVKLSNPTGKSSSDAESDNAVSVLPMPNSSIFSEGFDFHESFDNKFHQDSNLNASGSDFTSSHNTSHSPRSIWSECEGLQNVDQSFDDDFDSSFTPRTSDIKSSPRDETEIKDEKEKSSGYGSGNSRQTSETKDESQIDEDQKTGKEFSSLNDEDVDRIFDLAKDPPSFGEDSDVDDELSFEELNKEYRVPTKSSKIAHEFLNENDTEATNTAEECGISSKGEDVVLSKQKQKDSTVPKPIYSSQSPRVATTSRFSKPVDALGSSSICSDDDNTDATSTASRHQESDDMGMSSESEVIRSAFDFLGSSSDAETLITARETLMMLEEEEESEEEDLASSIKILSDLRKSLISENEDLFSEEIQDDQYPSEWPEEERKPPSPPAVSDDEDSSFQMDPRPAGVHSEIQVDIHRPNVEDSDNGSEMDAPLDALEDDVIVNGETLLCPEEHHGDTTTPRPEDFVDSSVHPLNRTFTISVDKCEEIDTSDTTSLKEDESSKSLADELKLPLWETDDQLSSGKSTPRGLNQLHCEESLHDSSFEGSNTSSELSIHLKDSVPNVVPSDASGSVVKPEATTLKTLGNTSDTKDSLTKNKEEYSEKPSGSISQRYIKKSQMDKRKAVLRRQKEIIHDDIDDENQRIHSDQEESGQTDSGDDGHPMEVTTSDSVTNVEGFHSGIEARSESRLDSNQNPIGDTRHFSETTNSSATSFHILSSASVTCSESAGEFSIETLADSPNSSFQTHLPEASVNLSDEFNVSGSSEEVWFDDLNKSLNNEKKNVISTFSPRAHAYRKSSEGDDSVMSEDSSPRIVVTDHKYDLPDVVQNPGTSIHLLSDNSIAEDHPQSDQTNDPYSRISEEGTILNDSKEEESYDLSFNSFISPYATTKSLAKISSTPKSLYKARTAEISCDGIEPVYDPYATIGSSKGDNSNESDRRCSGTSDISPYATVKDFSSSRLNEGVLFTSKEVLVEKSTDVSSGSQTDRTHSALDNAIRSIPEIRIQAPTDHEDELEDDSKTGQDIADLYAKVKKCQSKGENSTEQADNEPSLPKNHFPRGDDSITPLDSEVLGACGGCEELPDTEDEGPPLPQRKYARSVSSQSNLHSHRELSASRNSLFTNFKASAKVKFHTMRKAMSMDRGLDEVHEEKKKSDKKEKGKEKEKNKKDKKDKKKKKDEKLSKAPSLKSLSSIFGKKSKDRHSAAEGELQEKKDEPEKKGKKEKGSFFKSRKKPLVAVPIDLVDTPTHFRCIGKLRAVNPDGTNIVELSKPAEGPIGFYIAKGTANYDYGTFVSRFSDDQQKLFAGILGVGDEILEINEHPVKDMSLDDVHELMAGTETFVMKVFPIIARKEV